MTFAGAGRVEPGSALAELSRVAPSNVLPFPAPALTGRLSIAPHLLTTSLEHDKATAEASAKRVGDDGSELAPPPSNYVYKLDLRLIPLLGCTYTILFLDRTNSVYDISMPSTID